MGKNSGIEWTHNTFNPWWGCAKVSPACDGCYAERDAKRYASGQVLWGVDAARREFGDKHWDEPRRWNERCGKAGIRERVFCASMADVFDKNAPEGARDRLWKLIDETPHLDWLLLTKRISNARKMLPPNWLFFPRHNVWLGITVVNQDEADRDIPKLLDTPARLRFLSCEPLLGPINIARAGGFWSDLNDNVVSPPGFAKRDQIDWVIAGGESGAKFRPVHSAWLRQLRNDCEVAGVPFHFKQWGESRPYTTAHADSWEIAKQAGVLYVARSDDKGTPDEYHLKLGKKNCGRDLDGRTWDQVPS